MSDAATIAAGLTKAQRDFILTLDGRPRWLDRAIGEVELAHSLPPDVVLVGLASSAFGPPPMNFVLTRSLGLAVRAEILATLKDTDHHG